MITTLLFDLDGTLLPLDIDIFVKEYFNRLAHKFATLVPPQDLIDQVLRATQIMISSTDRTKTNAEVFVEDFFRDFSLPIEQAMPVFDDFYAQEFCHLKPYAGFNAMSRKVLEIAQKKGYNLVLATNPVFPKLAIEERLRWAKVDDFPFKLITTYENMHACKPNLAYYQEILDHLHLQAEECLMIGNDVEEDLVARTLGIKTFLVEDYLLNPQGITYETDYHGSLEDLMAFAFHKLPDRKQ